MNQLDSYGVWVSQKSTYNQYVTEAPGERKCEDGRPKVRKAGGKGAKIGERKCETVIKGAK
jgi:hypothetical protein